MTKVSPEYRDMDEMERWYKKLGDEYALWLIERVRELEEQIQVAEDIQSDEYNELEDKLSTFSKAVERIVDKMSDFLDDSETVVEDDYTILTEYVEDLRNAIP